ncbi:hypothetical protein QFZ81_000765 [Paenibacillus sp. V4I9]|nr:hypothetical protein [Paenibacillus sp. V4I9]
MGWQSLPINNFCKIPIAMVFKIHKKIEGILKRHVNVQI